MVRVGCLKDQNRVWRKTSLLLLPTTAPLCHSFPGFLAPGTGSPVAPEWFHPGGPGSSGRTPPETFWGDAVFYYFDGVRLPTW